MQVAVQSQLRCPRPRLLPHAPNVSRKAAIRRVARWPQSQLRRPRPRLLPSPFLVRLCGRSCWTLFACDKYALSFVEFTNDACACCVYAGAANGAVGALTG